MPFCPLKKYKNFFSISAFSSPAVTFLPFIYSPSLLTANRSHHPAAVSNQKKWPPTIKPVTFISRALLLIVFTYVFTMFHNEPITDAHPFSYGVD